MKPSASLSLDLDNLWAYQMTHGDPGWEDHPTYLPEVVPIFARLVEEVGVRITVFVVGQDAAMDVNRDALALITSAGHEVGNHSFRHQPWLHRYAADELHRELSDAEEAICTATGQRPRVFRGPGYSLSPSVVRTLAGLGYVADCSTLPTVIGPLARRFYFRTAKLDAAQREERAHLFGHARDALQPLGAYRWVESGGSTGDVDLLELPVTVLPYVRVPFHLSYVLYLAGRSEDLAVRYFAAGLRACRVARIEPSILLHPLDFVGADDVDALRFFPAMGLPGVLKRRVVGRCLALLAERFDVCTIGEHARRLRGRPDLPTRPLRRAGSTAESTAPAAVAGVR